MDENLFGSDHRKIAPRLMGLNREFTLRASQIRHRFRQERRILEVEDKGKGFNSAMLEQGSQDWMGALGVGVRGMNERMRQLKGKLEIITKEGGTLVRAIIPVGHEREPRT